MYKTKTIQTNDGIQLNVTGEGTKINYNLMTGILVKFAIIREKILNTQRMNRGKKLIKLENFNATPDGTLF